jgi:hypothetical protein
MSSGGQHFLPIEPQFCSASHPAIFLRARISRILNQAMPSSLTGCTVSSQFTFESVSSQLTFESGPVRIASSLFPQGKC